MRNMISKSLNCFLLVFELSNFDTINNFFTNKLENLLIVFLLYIYYDNCFESYAFIFMSLFILTFENFLFYIDYLNFDILIKINIIIKTYQKD